jgi:hypothetical protein
MREPFVFVIEHFVCAKEMAGAIGGTFRRQGAIAFHGRSRAATTEIARSRGLIENSLHGHSLKAPFPMRLEPPFGFFGPDGIECFVGRIQARDESLDQDDTIFRPQPKRSLKHFLDGHLRVSFFSGA